ncbi:uncharacterized protein LOC126898615 isoform X2 [Daktulosphaira vitifoliae]|uniref:uncharacterized protein LOC126898615 isoform X2 n=2 Tax=Daktulosphaira vitifoliae TaxID=58002 RepID=UPI0021AA3ABF|nr:uncharacterized protein LOC126898615 isoform X2 [Daktulosphaira vitifoliae]
MKNRFSKIIVFITVDVHNTKLVLGNMNKFILFSLIFATTVAVTLAAPKDKEIMLPGELKKNGDTVSASFGDFQASAGLSDKGAVASAGGSGLGAGARYGVDGVGASAVGTNVRMPGIDNKVKYGYGYGVESLGVAGQNAQSGVVGQQDFYKRIFSIPIDVLQSVNTYLNQKPTAVRKAAIVSDGVNGRVAMASNDHVQSGVTANAGPGSIVQKNYDQIFAIPISALKSTQNLLPGEKKSFK